VPESWAAKIRISGFQNQLILESDKEGHRSRPTNLLTIFLQPHDKPSDDVEYACGLASDIVSKGLREEVDGVLGWGMMGSQVEDFDERPQTSR
jgi:hypothetical protein